MHALHPSTKQGPKTKTKKKTEYVWLCSWLCRNVLSSNPKCDSCGDIYFQHLFFKSKISCCMTESELQHQITHGDKTQKGLDKVETVP